MTRCCPHCGKEIAGRSGMGLTAKQREVLDCIQNYAEGNGGMTPSYEEIAAHVGLRSRSGAFRIIAALEERGHVRKLFKHARAIEILSYGAPAQ